MTGKVGMDAPLPPDDPELEVFGRVIAAGEALDLSRAALLLGRIEDRALALEPSLLRLEELAKELRSLNRPAPEAIAWLFRVEGLRGNQADYEDPRNSFLHEVLERRLGIPISLSVAAIEAGRRAGINVEGLAFPGHFLIRVRTPSREGVVLDPFAGGIVLDDADLLLRLRATTGRLGSLGPLELGAATKVQILARMLRNLKAVYFKSDAIEKALAVEERMILLLPDDVLERRDRGLLLARLGRDAEAEADLRRYLKTTPAAPDAPAVERIADELRSRRGPHH